MLEGIQADELARALGLDVARPPVAQPPELLPGALGEQPRRPGTVVLEHQEGPVTRMIPSH